MQSELNHVPFDDGESDYGLIECTAQNSIGQQRGGACKFIFFKKGQHDSAYFGSAHASTLNLAFLPTIHSLTQNLGCIVYFYYYFLGHFSKFDYISKKLCLPTVAVSHGAQVKGLFTVRFGT